MNIRIHIFPIMVLVFTLSFAVFSEESGIWVQGPELHERRWGHGGVVVDGRIYVLGGVSDRRQVLNTIEIYDPDRNEWTMGPEMPVHCYYMSVVTVGRQIVIIGGIDQNRNIKNWVLAFDTENDEWSRLNELPEAREGAGVALDGRFILVMGGRAPREMAVETGFRYDLTENSWSGRVPPMSAPRANFGFVNAGNLIAVGGVDFGPVGSVEVFQDGSWRNLARMATPRGRMGCALLPGDSAIVLAGGIGHMQPPLEVVDQFNFRTREWSEMPSLNTSRADFVLLSHENKIYAIGGSTHERREEGVLNSVEIYTFPNNIPFESSSVNSPEVVSIYPNPANNQVNFVFNERLENFLIYDLTGHRLHFNDAFHHEGTWTLDAANLESGTYFIKVIESASQRSTIRSFTILK